METFVDQIRTAVHGRHPIIYLNTPEEDRILGALPALAKECLGTDAVYTWSCTQGLSSGDDQLETRDPVKAIRAILASAQPGFYVLKDLSAFLLDVTVQRSLRDAYYALGDAESIFLIIVAPDMVLPIQLEKEICLIDVVPPCSEELIGKMVAVEANYPDTSIPETLHEDVALSLRGLTLNEAGHILHSVCRSGEVSEKKVLDRIFREKQNLVKKSGLLEFVPLTYDVSQVGGLDNLKTWIVTREKIFNQESVDKGLPIPKGILLMGVSGCGKSLCAKVVAQLWKIPLFRLDMNLVYSGMHGSPEAAFHRALKTVESVAPSVLWIDEMENGLGMTAEGTLEQSHIFSAFLTWMQEKPPLIFVAGTANRIEALPAEIIRKGRFDEVFFCDLPDGQDREAIIRIHLRDNGANPDDFDIEHLVVATDNWNGAEIEQAVIAARLDAHREDRPFTFADIHRHTRSMVPLAETMSEQIKRIRSWARNRATPAARAKRRV